MIAVTLSPLANTAVCVLSAVCLIVGGYVLWRWFVTRAWEHCPKCQRWFCHGEEAMPQEWLTTSLIDHESLCDECFSDLRKRHEIRSLVEEIGKRKEHQSNG